MKNSRSGRVTQKQIADHLGISVMTVQRAIHGSGYVSEELRRKILEYMQRTNYRPHRAARSLVKGNHNSIALFSTSEPKSFWSDVERGVQMVADEIGYFGFDVAYSRIPSSDSQAYLRAINKALKNGADSIALVNNSEFDMQRIFDRLERTGVPYITMNIDAPDSDRLCFVGPDYHREGRIVAHHLHQVMGNRGHLIVVTGPEYETIPKVRGSEIEIQRVQGVRDYCSEVGGYDSQVLIWDHDDSVEAVATKLNRLRTKLGDRPCGVYIPHIEPEETGRLFGRLPPESGPVVLSYFSEETVKLLRSGRVSAVVYQDPVLQGYLATRILEHIVETGAPPARQTYVINQSLINKENSGVVDNLFLIRELRL